MGTHEGLEQKWSRETQIGDQERYFSLHAKLEEFVGVQHGLRVPPIRAAQKVAVRVKNVEAVPSDGFKVVSYRNRQRNGRQNRRFLSLLRFLLRQLLPQRVSPFRFIHQLLGSGSPVQLIFGSKQRIIVHRCSQERTRRSEARGSGCCGMRSGQAITTVNGPRDCCRNDRAGGGWFPHESRPDGHRGDADAARKQRGSAHFCKGARVGFDVDFFSFGLRCLPFGATFSYS
mmetsp:Transcript_19243/g.48143  ORF Transcript_19243/g.48143 Transcript_19243/m.48143 type:complete len:230 (+) Transcript_19243:608-1297(+)